MVCGRGVRAVFHTVFKILSVLKMCQIQMLRVEFGGGGGGELIYVFLAYWLRSSAVCAMTLFLGDMSHLPTVSQKPARPMSDICHTAFEHSQIDTCINFTSSYAKCVYYWCLRVLLLMCYLG